MLDVLGVSTNVAAMLFIAAMVAGSAKGFSGFGAGLIFVPSVSAILDPKLAAAIFLVMDGITVAPIFRSSWHLSDKKAVGILAFGATLSTPIGAFILVHSNFSALRWTTSAVSFIVLLVLTSGWRFKGSPTPTKALGVGCLAGLLQGISQASGPAVLLYWLGGPLPITQFRANIIIFFAILTLITTIAYASSGLLTNSVFSLSLMLVLPYMVGFYTGRSFFMLASETAFRRICYTLIAIAALIGLPIYS